MTPNPKYPYRPRSTRSLLGSLVVAAIMLAILLALTSCSAPPVYAAVSPGEFAVIAFVSLLFVLRRKRS